MHVSIWWPKVTMSFVGAFGLYLTGEMVLIIGILNVCLFSETVKFHSLVTP